jgi:hypothetical protein
VAAERERLAQHRVIGPRRGRSGEGERARLVGGTLEIESAPGGGTTVFARVPVSLPEEGAVD